MKAYVHIGALLISISAFAVPVRREVPIRFDWPASYAPLILDTGWFRSALIEETRGYLRANAVPYAFDACARLVFQFDSSDVWPGNTFPCQVWVEPYDSPDLMEVRSDFGAQFGLEFREYFSHINLYSFTKDFMFAIEGNGGLPLGNQLIGGWDTVEFLSLPIDDFLPLDDDDVAKAILQGLLDVADANGCSIGTLELMAEAVVQGHYLQMRVGETDVVLTQPGAAHAKTAFINVPMEISETLADTFEFFVEPTYNFSIWKAFGAKLTAVGPLAINLVPAGFDPSRLLPGSYSPPPLSTVTSYYQQAVARASSLGQGAAWVSVPISGRPPLPDLVVHDIVINPSDPQSQNRAFANEVSTLSFTLSNFGGAPTAITDEMVVRLLVNGHVVETRVLNNKGANPQLVLNTNESVQLAFQYQFEEGSYAVEIRSGLASLKGYADGQPVYGMGDPFVGNNMRPFRLYCAPRRGSIVGRVFSNPTFPGEGIDGIRVRLSGLYRTMETNSGYDAVSDSHGIYRFERVYPGNFCVEFLPPPPTNTIGPRYYPRSVHFQHTFDVTDLREGSGLFMRQYQRLNGFIVDRYTNAVSNAVVRLSDAGLIETRSDAKGRFVLTNVPPSGAFTLIVEHPEFLAKRIQFQMDVQATAQTDTELSGYLELPSRTWVNGPYVFLDLDTTPPVIELQPFGNDGLKGNPVVFYFNGSDQDGRCTPTNYRWLVKSSDGSVLLQSAWINWPTNTPPGIVATATANLSSLADGPYLFQLEAKDRAGNISSTPAQPFRLDKTPPQVAVTIANGTAVTASRMVPVDVSIGNFEPGTLRLELSNDGSTWCEPWLFISNAFHVSDWEISKKEVQSVPIFTVYARVTDAVGLQTIASDTIELASVGAVRLAYGWEAWTNTIVPLEIGITPPDGVLQKRLGPWADTLRVGGQTLDRHRAQAFVLPTSITFNRVRFSLSRIVGEPMPLTLRVAPSLNNADPAGAGSAVWSWTGTAEDIRLASLLAPDGRPPATSGAGTVLPAGTNFLIISCDESDPQNYYEFFAGRHIFNYDGGPRFDHTGNSWQVGPEEPPGMGIPTFVFDLYHSPNGEIRICTDGTPDTEPWMAFPYPDDPFRTAMSSGEGLFTVIVGYRNTVDPSRDGTHVDTVIIDRTPPIVHNASISSVDRASRGILLDLDVTDAQTRVAGMSWRFDDAPWSFGPYQRKPFLYCPASFRSLTLQFYDAAANETAPINLIFPVDMSKPALIAYAANDQTNIRIPEIHIFFHAEDDTAIDRIELRESRSGTNYGPYSANTGDVLIELPRLRIGERHGIPLYEFVDGEYRFEAQAFDTSSNASSVVVIPVLLDRQPPFINMAVLTGSAGEAPVTGTNLVLRLDAQDNLGPLEMRWRWREGVWSPWSSIAQGRSGTSLTGYWPMPTAYHVDVEVRDRANWTVSSSCSVSVNRPPETPDGIRPYGDTGDPPFLFGSDFRDPDGDRWGASQFVVRGAEEIVLDTGPLQGADRYHVPYKWLRRGEKYQWRCRYMDPYGAASEWSSWLPFTLQLDTDGDGIPDDIEVDFGTDPGNPDSDDDAIPDGLEDLNANGLVDPGESDPRVADTDGDTLEDGKEDRNGNARLDPDETSPCLADTDTDGADDGHESRAGTNPRDPTASFRISSFQRLSADGTCRIVWLGRNGRTYTVMSRSTLYEAPVAVASFTAAGGLPPWYVVPMEWTASNSPAQVFYSVVVNEAP